MGIKFRLIVMNFLQYAIWGSWLISLGAYLGGGLQFTGLQIGSFFATMGIASLFMPALMGIIADRWIPAQKLLGICQLISAGFLVAAASQTAYGPLYTCMLMSVMFYMPTIALSNSVAYNALDLAKLDAVKHFPPIRVWGTVGFIAAMWFVDLVQIGGVQIKLTYWQLYVSAILSLILAIYSFTLPGCPVSHARKSQSWIDTLGLRAFALFKEKRMAIFFIFSMLLGWAINSAMILLAAATFFVTKTPVEELQQADSLLQPLLGRSATHIFAVALLFAGISSTITSGMAAGSIFAGIFKEPYDIRDNHSRTGVMVSLVVAFLIILLIGDPFKGLIYSQMILSIQLPFTVFLQVHLTSSERVMGKYRNSRFTKYLLYGIGAVVTVLNVMLLVSFFR